MGKPKQKPGGGDAGPLISSGDFTGSRSFNSLALPAQDHAIAKAREAAQHSLERT